MENWLYIKSEVLNNSGLNISRQSCYFENDEDDFDNEERTFSHYEVYLNGECIGVQEHRNGMVTVSNATEETRKILEPLAIK